MKKSIVIGATAALGVALAYPATAWYLGQKIEAELDEQYKLLEGYPYLKVVQRDFQRGIFSSTETVTIEVLNFAAFAKPPVPAPQPPAAAEGNAEAAPEQPAPPPAPVEAPKPLRITVQSDYQHGPFPGFAAFAAGTSESHLVLDEQQQKAVREVFGDQVPLQASTVYRFDGGGAMTLSSPAFTFNYKLKQPDGEERSMQGAWKGVRMTADFSAGLRQYSMQIDAPGLDMQDSKGERFEISGLHADGDHQRLFDEEPLFYAGNARFSIERIAFNGTTKNAEGEEKKNDVNIQKLVYEASLPVSGDFLDVIGKIGVNDIAIDSKNYGPAHYDFSLRHLHARTVATLYRGLLKAYADPAKLFADQQSGQPFQAFAGLKEPALTLLKYGPEVRIDRISFTSPDGEAKISAGAKLGELKDEELANPFMLIGKLSANADISMPEALISEKFSPEQLGAYVDQGFVERNGAILHTTVAFANGQLTVNGKPFNPMAAAAPPAAAAQ